MVRAEANPRYALLNCADRTVASPTGQQSLFLLCSLATTPLVSRPFGTHVRAFAETFSTLRHQRSDKEFSRGSGRTSKLTLNRFATVAALALTIAFVATPVPAGAQVKAGDLITSDNASKVETLVSPGNLILVKQGMTMKIVPTSHPPESNRRPADYESAVLDRGRGRYALRAHFD
jgi:hypothetical protein